MPLFPTSLPPAPCNENQRKPLKRFVAWRGVACDGPAPHVRISYPGLAVMYSASLQ